MSEIELKPCPFCGEHLERSDNLSTRSNTVWLHPVTDELCVAQFVIGSSDRHRVEAWNRRAPNPDLAAKDAEITRLEAENERMREALEPFALIAEHDIGDTEDDDDLFQSMSERNASVARLRVGHLRRAVAALSPIPDPAGGMPVEVKPLSSYRVDGMDVSDA